MDIEHLHRAEFLQDRARRQAGRQIAQPAAERHLETIGEKGDEDVRFDSLQILMYERSGACPPP